MKIKRPNIFLYFIAYILIYPMLKLLFRFEANRDHFDLPKGPCLFLANHLSLYDFLFVMLPMFPKRRINAVTAQKFFFAKSLHKILPKLGCIPKNMFDPDVRSIVGIKAVLKRGDSVLLFPEGRCSSSMAYSGMHRSTGKLVEKLGVPVVSCFIEGGEICAPHWRKWFRFGKVRVTYRNLFSKSDLSSLSTQEISSAIDARLSGAEGTAPAHKPFRTVFARKLAEGLSRILFYCPSCESEFELLTSKNTISCSSCGFSATMDKQGLLTSSDANSDREHISIWFGKQARFVGRSINENMEPIVDNVKVSTPSPEPGGGMVVSGAGTMTIDRSGWRFEGIMHGENATLFFPVDSVPAISYDHQKNYQIFSNGDYFTFTPSDLRMCIKYVVLAECLHWKFASEPRLTAGVNSGFATAP
ncbi:MAG: 1-acyl-sn-glycerol-3-phosphate acyltransferase [Oscillospiraceae bacterium]|nr:1-acyl-sn-glycerol-3-phosphate acyltransferase [Oscillospiraceae bacterium]